MSNKAFKILLIFFLFTLPAYSQDPSTLPDKDDMNTNRIRILFGYSHFVEEDRDPEYGNVFINANYRVNNFDSAARPMNIKWSFEGGLNVLKLTHTRATGVGLVPYIKTGPVINIAKNLSAGGSIGMVLSFSGYSFILPYFGANAYYSLPVNENLFLELEAGGHSSFSFNKPHSLIYFTAGIGLR